MTWDPTQYNLFSDERSRPFHELVGRIAAGQNELHSIVDLGCGPGNLTKTLADHWPLATVTGVDNDSNMLASAAREPGLDGRLRFEFGEISTWRPAEPVDAIVANAAYQWVPGHLELLPQILSAVHPGGWFAFQVPGNLDDPHHQIIRATRKEPPFSSIPVLKDLPERTHDSHSATTYLDALAPICTRVDAWETSYVHILQGPDPVLEWIKGTALRPVLQLLPTTELQTEFLERLAPRLADAFPSRPWGTPFPFKRVFVVAQR